MCCENMNDAKEVDKCKDCGSGIDSDGYSTEVCGFSPVECDTCGWAPCNENC